MPGSAVPFDRDRVPHTRPSTVARRPGGAPIASAGAAWRQRRTMTPARTTHARQPAMGSPLVPYWSLALSTRRAFGVAVARNA